MSNTPKQTVEAKISEILMDYKDSDLFLTEATDKIMALLNPVEKSASMKSADQYSQGSKPQAPKGEAKNPIKITRICFEADIVAEVYDYGQGVSMMKVFEMINKGELKIKTPDIVMTKPVIIFKDKIL